MTYLCAFLMLASEIHAGSILTAPIQVQRLGFKMNDKLVLRIIHQQEVSRRALNRLLLRIIVQHWRTRSWVRTLLLEWYWEGAYLKAANQHAPGPEEESSCMVMSLGVFQIWKTSPKL